ncbi:hypothetical protein MG293_012019 [Ovis ammon polii]|uniref:Uncharacterized protein n=1 Tax=Ovis ammon polii TaxID=230172 RepID=A0AAD4Y9S0_OVIAM|nr:hypothetical protein MG293_012019 [Ovis ammon polii]
MKTERMEKQKFQEPQEPHVDSPQLNCAGQQPSADLKGLIHAVNVKVSFKRKKKEKEEMSRKLHEENQTNEERMGQIKRLQTEQTSLRSENAQLEREIQKLWLKLEMLPELHQEQVRQLLRKSTAEATCRLEVERRCPHVSRRLDYASQKRSLCGKMAEDIERELERAACSGLSELLWRERRARGRTPDHKPLHLLSDGTFLQIYEDTRDMGCQTWETPGYGYILGELGDDDKY